MAAHIPINKIKSIVIGDGMVFRPHKNTVKDITSGKKGTLNNVASHLLLYLLQNGKNISTRDEILQNVFQHNGARATDANLNQHISFLRKVITSIGHSAELVITIPRMGFRISDARINFQLFEESPVSDIDAEADSDVHINSNTNTDPPNRAQPVAAKKPVQRLIVKFSALITIFLIITTYWYTGISQTLPIPQASVLRTVKLQQCQIHILGNTYTDSISKDKAMAMFRLVDAKPDCSTQKDIYISAWASNNQFINWTFTAECGYNNGYYYCSNHYHHQEEWSES